LKATKPDPTGLCYLQCSHIVIKEIFKFFIGKHLVNEFEDSLFIILVNPHWRKYVGQGMCG
jgi:hypothetical protein